MCHSMFSWPFVAPIQAILAFDLTDEDILTSMLNQRALPLMTVTIFIGHLGVLACGRGDR